MYCSTCSSAVSPNLTYCNHCGAKLSATKADAVTRSSDIKLESLLFFMTAVFIFGLGGIIGLMMALKFVFGPDYVGLIIAFTLLSFLIMLAVEGVFVWMLLGRKKGVREIGDTEPLNKQTAKEPGQAKVNLLPAPELSVTEHTTRALEPKDIKYTTG